MKNPSAGFLTIQKRENLKPVYHVYYKRRYWDAGTSKYIYEAAWTQLSDDEVLGVDAPVHEFDTQTLNAFMVSNTTLYFKNDKMQWKEGTHAESKFLADGVSAFGYEPYLMMFQIKAGFSNVGEKDIRQGSKSEGDYGSEELLTLFTGVLNDLQMETETRTAKIVVEGLERLLLNCDAEIEHSDVALEVIGTGDDLTTEFYTANNGVKKITAVTVAGTAIDPGTDYEIGDLNDYENPGKVKILNAPASGSEIKCTYEYWKKNLEAETFISELVVSAGIASSTIAQMTNGDITQNFSQNSKAEYDAGTNTNCDTSSKVGAILPDFFATTNKTLSDDFNAGTLTDNGWVGVGGSAGGGQKHYIDGGAYLVKDGDGTEITTWGLRKMYPNSQKISFGVWETKVKYTDPNGSEVRWLFTTDSDDPVNVFSGYSIYFGADVGVSDVNFETWVDGVRIKNTPLAITLTTNFQTVTVTRDFNYIFRIYLDGVLISTFKDDKFEGGDRMAFWAGMGGAVAIIYFDDIYLPNSSAITMTHISQQLDSYMGSPVWGNVNLICEKLDIDSFAITTSVSANGAAWDDYVAVGAGNSIESDSKRYIKIKFVISISPQSRTLADIAKILKYSYQVQSSPDLFLAMGNFAGMNVYTAIQELEKLGDCEWGLDDEGAFFSRARTPSAAPDMTFTQKDILQILYQNNGYEFIYPIVRASFGEFVKEITSSSGSRTSYLEILGKRVFEITSSMLLNKDTNIADALATVYHTRLSAKRRRLRIMLKFHPQIELSDTLSISFNHDPYNAALEPFISAFIGKVIYTKHDPVNVSTEVELEEIV